MNVAKSLILSSAAGLIAMSGAQAADLPMKAKAVEYVKICSLYGAGFFYIPGTDTCIKLGGYLRVDMGVNTNAIFTNNTSGAGGAKNRYTNAFTWRSREDLTIDTRTATEYGVVRTFFDATFTWTDDTYAGNPAAPGSSIYSSLGGGSLSQQFTAPGVTPFPAGTVLTTAPAAAGGNANSGGVATGALGVYYAFIQFAGFTMGKAISTFSAPWTNYPGNLTDALVGGGGTVTGVNQFTYTAELGNGTSLSFSAQDPVQYYQAGVNNLSAGGAFGASNYAGNTVPDFVASLRVDQAWGLFQLSAAAHNNNPGYYGGASTAPGTPGFAAGTGTISGTEAAGGPGDKWGYAVQAALSIKNIPTGPGDVINIQGVYTEGATRYNIQDLASGLSAATVFGKSGLSSTGQSVGFGTAADTVFANGTGQQLIQTWGMRGAYTHNWNAYWNTAIFGAYAQVHYNGTSQTMICGGGGAVGTFRATFGAGITSCNPDYSIAQLGTVTRWTPVKNLTFSGEFFYNHLDQRMAGLATVPLNVPIGKQSGTYELRDQDTYQFFLRAQRNF